VVIRSLERLNDTDISFDKICELKPSFCDFISTSQEKVVFEMDTGCKSNGNRVSKYVQFHPDGTFDFFVGDRKSEVTEFKC
jgi:hypothetical protein